MTFKKKMTKISIKNQSKDQNKDQNKDPNKNKSKNQCKNLKIFKNVNLNNLNKNLHL